MKIIFSFIIPIFNNQKTIDKLLDKLLIISDKYNIEIIIINSGSTDNSPQIIQNYKDKNHNIKIINIKKEDFHHSKTRNMAVKIAKGKYICFISPDAIPLNNDFIDFFKEDLENNSKVVAIFGKHVPYPDTPTIQKIEELCAWQRLDNYVNNSGILIQNIHKPFIPFNEKNKFLWYFISNAFSCYKRSFLLRNPFPKTNYAEDILLGRIIINKGLVKIYDNRAIVKHSHYHSLFQYYKRQLDEYNVKYRKLYFKRKTNVLCKIVKIFNLNLSFIQKIVVLFELLLYYFIKALVMIRLGFIQNNIFFIQSGLLKK